MIPLLNILYRDSERDRERGTHVHSNAWFQTLLPPLVTSEMTCCYDHSTEKKSRAVCVHVTAWLHPCACEQCEAPRSHLNNERAWIPVARDQIHPMMSFDRHKLHTITIMKVNICNNKKLSRNEKAKKRQRSKRDVTGWDGWTGCVLLSKQNTHCCNNNSAPQVTTTTLNPTLIRGKRDTRCIKYIIQEAYYKSHKSPSGFLK